MDSIRYIVSAEISCSFVDTEHYIAQFCFWSDKYCSYKYCQCDITLLPYVCLDLLCAGLRVVWCACYLKS